MAINKATISQYRCLADKLVRPNCFALISMNDIHKGQQISNFIVASNVLLCENDNEAVYLEGDTLILCLHFVSAGPEWTKNKLLQALSSFL